MAKKKDDWLEKLLNSPEAKEAWREMQEKERGKCPPVAVLGRYIRGNCTEDEARVIRKHLGACLPCYQLTEFRVSNPKLKKRRME